MNTADGPRPLRVLFLMQYPGYLRYFDSTVRLLAERGHHVDVVFDNPLKQSEGAEALDDVTGDVEVLVGAAPRRSDLWGFVGKAIRGTIDYARYLHPSFADTPYLRDRMRSAVPRVFAWLRRRNHASERMTRRLVACLMALEKAIPSSTRIERFIRSRRPDLVIVTPLVTDRCPQVEFVKSANALGIPSALCVASWDHLTTKGLIRLIPDLVTVWNDTQHAEAVEFHAVPPERILVTGAQPFDRWFTRTATVREEFCRRIGLRADRPFVLFVGSTKSISAPDAEVRFVRSWVEAVRRESELANVGILIRPHPYNAAHWSDVDLSDLPEVAVYPRKANPVNEQDRQVYFDSLYHSSAVVGVNTTAMIEAAIVGRTVHTITGDDFKGTQGGTLHFRYLLSENGGFLRIAEDLAAHTRQLAETLRRPEIGRQECERFVGTFIRPAGMDRPSTPVLVDGLERLARAPRPQPAALPLYLYPARFAMWLGGAVALYRRPDRLRRVARDWASRRWRAFVPKTKPEAPLHWRKAANRP